MKKEYFIIIILILVALASFGLGRLSVLDNKYEEDDIEFIIPNLSKIDMSFKGFSFVASVNGTKYYPRGCKAVNRINVGNRIYFKTGLDAKKSGYEYTSAC